MYGIAGLGVRIRRLYTQKTLTRERLSMELEPAHTPSKWAAMEGSPEASLLREARQYRQTI